MNMSFKATLGALALFSAAHSALAAEVTLRLHQLLPPQATIPAKAIAPWAKKIETDSGNRIKIQQFPAMQLGGKPSDLLDQVKDGVVDIVWTVLGYTPGRFPKAEAFELPFVSGKAEPSSRAFQEFVEKNTLDEFKDVHLIAVHVHGPRHHSQPRADHQARRLEGHEGARRLTRDQHHAGAARCHAGRHAGAVDRGKRCPKGVVSASTIPWEVVPSLKIQQIVKNHTQFSGDVGLYTQTFALMMNKASYEKLPADLKKVIDANSGIETAALFGRAMDEGDKVGVRAGEGGWQQRHHVGCGPDRALEARGGRHARHLVQGSRRKRH